MSVVRPTIYEWAFAQAKQTHLFVPIAGASLTKKLPYREFTPVTQEKAIHSDRPYFGKGHDFAERVDEIGQQPHFSRTFDATSESLSWGLSLLMGSVSTGAPSSGIYPHTIKFVSPAVQKECLYTTIIEKAGNEYQKLVAGVYIESVALTAEGRENIQIAVTASGRKQVDDVTVLPAVTKTVVFRHNHATMNFGSTGTEVEISDQVVRWSLNLAQNPDVRWMPGQSSGDEKYMRYAFVGTQAISGSIAFFMDKTLRDLFLNHDKCGLTISNYGVLDSRHKFKIEIPVVYINQEAIAQGGQTTELTLSWNEDVTLKDADVVKSPITITLENNLATLLN